MGKQVKITLKADDVAEIMLYGVIGGGFFDDGIDAADFRKQVKAVKAKTINLRINSPGGSAIEAGAILSALDDFRASGRRVEVDVDGLAASAASVVAMASDRVRVASNALLMIHDPHVMMMGGAAELRRTADLLDTVKEQILDRYHGKAKATTSREQIADWMQEEKWFNGVEAVAAGLADEATGAVRVAAFAEYANILAKAGYKHTPPLPEDREGWIETEKRRLIAAQLCETP